jgi:hypothetical protein
LYSCEFPTSQRCEQRRTFGEGLESENRPLAKQKRIRKIPAQVSALTSVSFEQLLKLGWMNKAAGF